VHRPFMISLAALLLCSCNAPDAVSVMRDGLGEIPASAKSVGATRVDLGTLGGANSYAADISDANIVVGWSETAAGAVHAFRWTDGAGMVDLGTLPGDATSRAVAVLKGGTEGGTRILGVSTSASNQSTIVLWSESAGMVALPIPSSGFTLRSANDFNVSGDVVGWDAGGVGFEHAWIWSETDGKYDLTANAPTNSTEGSASAVNASGSVLVTTNAFTCRKSDTCWRTYLWTRKSGYQALGAPGNEIETAVTGAALNERGTVVGSFQPYTEPYSQPRPYSWTAGVGFTALERYSTDNALFGYAMDVNSSGTVVGADVYPSSGRANASRWAPNGAIVRLDANPSVAVAINDSNTAAGWVAVSTGVSHAAIWMPSLPAADAVLNPSASVSVDVRSAALSTRSGSCLTNLRATTSRQALFTCVMNADRNR
jgi:probable HAF family extracellular repeat protein